MDVQVPQVYNDMVQWEQAHEKNDIALGIMLDNEEVVEECGEESIFEPHLERRDKIGTEFDFMEGKDPLNDKEYVEQLGKLAQGDMAACDLDGDGLVSRSEYMKHELKDLKSTDDKEFRELAATYAYLMFDVIDQKMGNSNSNGKIEESEFESLYRNLDSFDGETLGDEDGKLNIDACSSFVAWLIDNNVITKDDYDYAYKKGIETIKLLEENKNK